MIEERKIKSKLKIKKPKKIGIKRIVKKVSLKEEKKRNTLILSEEIVRLENIQKVHF